MINPVFGEVNFNVGWKTTTNILYFGEDRPVILKIKAYFEEDGITPEQEQSYLAFTQNKQMKFKTIERLLNDYSDEAQKRFTPQMLLFERDGSYALLCDDNNDPDDGIAVCLAPVEQIVSQDNYL